MQTVTLSSPSSSLSSLSQSSSGISSNNVRKSTASTLRDAGPMSEAVFPADESVSTFASPTSSGQVSPVSSSSMSSTASLRSPAVVANQQQQSSDKRMLLHTSRRRSSVATLGAGSGAAAGNARGQPARVVYTNESTGSTISFSLIKEVSTVGRKEDNTIVLNDAKISKYHATFEKEQGCWCAKDLNSSNGVKVNGKQITANTRHRLVDGDRVQIGSITLIFYEEPPLVVGNKPSGDASANFSLVTILPSERKYEETVSIHAELRASAVDQDFPPEAEITDIETMRMDYEKLRLAYQISKLALTSNLNELLAKIVDLMFSVLPAIDRCVVLLLDQDTQQLMTNMVKLREGKGHEGKEILLSSTILQRVYDTGSCLITSDACEDPQLGKSKSIARGQIRSVICVPLIAHDKFLGILHLDSKERIGAFVEKDLALVKTICTQTSLFIENAMLFKDSEVEIKAREQLSRFLPPQVVQKMIQAQETVRKGGVEKVGTVIFADIRGFTRLSERSTPSEVFDLLNDFFERLVKIVFKYNGVVDKYIGDALMCVFGTLDDKADWKVDPDFDSEFKAVAAALEMKKAVNEMNEERVRHGKEPIAVGIGLNTGDLVSGFVGCAQRLEYTVIGDTVNTSSRICGLAEANQVLMGESTFWRVQKRIDTRFLGLRQLKGKSETVGVYEALAIRDEGSYNHVTLRRTLSTRSHA